MGVVRPASRRDWQMTRPLRSGRMRSMIIRSWSFSRAASSPWRPEWAKSTEKCFLSLRLRQWAKWRLSSMMRIFMII